MKPEFLIKAIREDDFHVQFLVGNGSAQFTIEGIKEKKEAHALIRRIKRNCNAKNVIYCEVDENHHHYIIVGRGNAFFCKSKMYTSKRRCKDAMQLALTHIPSAKVFIKHPDKGYTDEGGDLAAE